MKLKFLKEFICFSKYRNFGGGCFSLMLSIFNFLADTSCNIVTVGECADLIVEFRTHVSFFLLNIHVRLYVCIVFEEKMLKVSYLRKCTQLRC